MSSGRQFPYFYAMQKKPLLKVYEKKIYRKIKRNKKKMIKINVLSIEHTKSQSLSQSSSK